MFPFGTSVRLDEILRVIREPQWTMIGGPCKRCAELEELLQEALEHVDDPTLEEWPTDLSARIRKVLGRGKR
jgi:hypothetical protein